MPKHPSNYKPLVCFLAAIFSLFTPDAFSQSGTPAPGAIAALSEEMVWQEINENLIPIERDLAANSAIGGECSVPEAYPKQDEFRKALDLQGTPHIIAGTTQVLAGVVPSAHETLVFDPKFTSRCVYRKCSDLGASEVAVQFADASDRFVGNYRWKTQGDGVQCLVPRE
jgi:hypothetical protein